MERRIELAVREVGHLVSLGEWRLAGAERRVGDAIVAQDRLFEIEAMELGEGGAGGQVFAARWIVRPLDAA